MGENHYIQPNQAGRVSVFAMSPPNSTIGMVKAGAIDVAVCRLGANDDIVRPIPIAV